MNRIFVDTNILIYSIDEDSKFYSKSQEILFNSNSQLFTSSKNLSEFLSVVTRFPINALLIEDALIAVKDFKIFLPFFILPKYLFRFLRNCFKKINQKD